MKQLFIISLFSFSKLFAQIDVTVDGKSDEDGFAIMVGFGSLYGGGIGGLLEYQHLLKENRRISPFLSVDAVAGQIDIKGTWLGGCAGVNFEFGKKLRWTIGINYGSHGIGYDTHYLDVSDSSKVEFVNRHVLIGPALVLGYKYTSHTGFIWQLNAGIAYTNNPSGDDKKYFFGPTVGLGIGYKL